MFDFYGYSQTAHAHTYTLASTGLGHRNVSKIFSSRQEANEYMYSLVSKYGLQCEEVYDDHHDKTYLYNNGIRFYIQRA